MIKAIIIDDEQHCIDRLSRLLIEDHGHGVRLEGAFQNAGEGLRAIHTLHPDLVFLDVQLDGSTGFDLLQQIPAIHFDIIFTTAFEKYAIQAFKFSAIDYLLKPIARDGLRSALGRLSEKIYRTDASKKIETLLHNLQGSKRRICVPVISGLVFIQVDEIIRCQSDVNYTTLFLVGKQKLVVAKTLKEFEELLTDYGFFRVHNSHLVNLAFIKRYDKGKGGTLTMTDHSIVEVSTRRKDEFLKRLKAGPPYP